MRLHPDRAAKFASEMAEARAARRRGDRPAAWAALERAHVLGQPCPVAHTWSHAAMLLQGCRDLDLRECLGQLPRLLLGGLGSALGRFPLGNTGRARVGMMTPMPIPEALKPWTDL